MAWAEYKDPRDFTVARQDRSALQTRLEYSGLYTRGEDYIQLAREIGIKRTIAHQIVRRAQEHDGAVAVPQGGLRSVKMSEEMLETIFAIVSDHPDYTLIMINQELRVRLPDAPHVTSSTIRTTNNHEKAQRRAGGEERCKNDNSATGLCNVVT
ncbi:hypothetical protein ElyMa_000347700 [Elysia marginata]|uniref:Uncharacterized protein n=1 Tax=Elysia marginata TaxID=1093978 RepID=A0AAV4FE99_9GAST|nr:hypothetical protein ElyMa_000347700 [Elysia marginata]